MKLKGDRKIDWLYVFAFVGVSLSTFLLIFLYSCF